MRAVRSRCGVHFKHLEIDAPDPPTPGLEYVAYAFASALTEFPLVTPSVFLKLENVLLPNHEKFPSVLSQAKIENHHHTQLGL